MKSDPHSKSDNGATPFERFQELARKLIAVPKEELEQEAAKEEKRPRKPRKVNQH